MDTHAEFGAGSPAGDAAMLASSGGILLHGGLTAHTPHSC